MNTHGIGGGVAMVKPAERPEAKVLLFRRGGVEESSCSLRYFQIVVDVSGESGHGARGTPQLLVLR